MDYNLSMEAIYEFSFPANQTSIAVNVLIIDDGLMEANESFYLKIGAKLNPLVKRGDPYNVSVTIVDNDGKSMCLQMCL